MESLVGKKFEYKGLKIDHLTVLTEPRVGYFLSKKKRELTSNKSCNTVCVCGAEKEVKFLDITHRHTTTCKGCGRSKGEVAFKRAKSLFEFWMRQWKPETHKPCTFKLPYFKGGVGEEYIAGFCYVDRGMYEKFKVVMWVKAKNYVLYNKSKDNCARLGEEYKGCRVDKSTFIHREVISCTSEVTDHENGKTLDNRRYNLREATIQKNNFNKIKLDSNTSGYTGVVKRKSDVKWCAQIMYKGISFNKSCISIEDAIIYRDVLAIVLFKEFCKLNLPEKERYYKENLLKILSNKHIRQLKGLGLL